jgi:hypothetical protein
MMITDKSGNTREVEKQLTCIQDALRGGGGAHLTTLKVRSQVRHCRSGRRVNQILRLINNDGERSTGKFQRAEQAPA